MPSRSKSRTEIFAMNAHWRGWQLLPPTRRKSHPYSLEKKKRNYHEQIKNVFFLPSAQFPFGFESVRGTRAGGSDFTHSHMPCRGKTSSNRTQRQQETRTQKIAHASLHKKLDKKARNIPEFWRGT